MNKSGKSYRIFKSLGFVCVLAILVVCLAFGIYTETKSQNLSHATNIAESYANAEEYLLPLITDQSDPEDEYDLSSIYPIFVENQTTSDLCWVYASLKSLETTLAIATNEYYNFSETAVALLAYMNGNSQAINSTGTFEKFNVVTQTFGLVYENDFSNDKYLDINESNYQNYSYVQTLASKDVLNTVKPIIFANSTTFSASSLEIKEKTLKKFISEFGGIYVGIEPGTIYLDSFGYAYKNEDDNIAQGPDGRPLNSAHAVCLIGYDSNGFIALNSWGMEYSYNSIFYIPFDYEFIYNNAYGYIYVGGENVSLISSNAGEFSAEILNSSITTENYFICGENVSLTYSVSDSFNFESIYVDIFKGTENVTDRFSVSYNDALKQITISNLGDVSLNSGMYLIKIHEDMNLIAVKNFSVFSGTEVAYFKLSKSDVSSTVDSYALFNGFASSSNNMTFYIYGNGSYTLNFYLTNLNRYSATGNNLSFNINNQNVYETINGEVIKSSIQNSFRTSSINYSNLYTIYIEGLSEYVGKRIEFVLTIRSTTGTSVSQNYYVNIFVGNYGTAGTNLANSIEYRLDGGVNSIYNVSRYPDYSLESDMTQIYIYSPSKTGYNFLGWYSDENFQNQVININASFSEDFVLYALWEQENVEYFSTEMVISSITDYDGTEKNVSDDIIYGDSVVLSYNFTEGVALSGSGRNYTHRYYLYVNGEEVGGEYLEDGNQSIEIPFNYPELLAGNYEIQITTAIVIMHSLNITSQISFNLEVNQKQIEFQFDNLALKQVYNGNEYNPLELNAISYSGVYAEDIDSFSFTLSDTPKKDCGSYRYYVSSINNDNYIYNESTFGVLYIEQKLLEVNWSNLRVTYNGEPRYVNYTLGGVVDGESVDLVLSGDGQINVGEYVVTVSGISSANYKVETGIYTTINILPAVITITFNNVTDRLQTAPLYRNEVTYQISGTIFNNDDIGLEIVCDGLTSTSSGEYIITGRCTNSNYDVYFNDAIYTLTGYYYVYYTLPNGEFYTEIVNDGEDPKGINQDIYPKGALEGYTYSESLENKGMDLYVTVTITNYSWIPILVAVIVVFVVAYLIVTRKQRKNKVS